MKHIILISGLAMFWASAAQSACFVEYKAKQDDPLRLHYGIMQLDDASCDQAQVVAAARLQQHGWTLLNVLGVSQETPTQQQQDTAGENYLRF